MTVILLFTDPCDSHYVSHWSFGINIPFTDHCDSQNISQSLWQLLSQSVIVGKSLHQTLIIVTVIISVTAPSGLLYHSPIHMTVIILSLIHVTIIILLTDPCDSPYASHWSLVSHYTSPWPLWHSLYRISDVFDGLYTSHWSLMAFISPVSEPSWQSLYQLLILVRHYTILFSLWQSLCQSLILLSVIIPVTERLWQSLYQSLTLVTVIVPTIGPSVNHFTSHWFLLVFIIPVTYPWWYSYHLVILGNSHLHTPVTDAC